MILGSSCGAWKENVWSESVGTLTNLGFLCFIQIDLLTLSECGSLRFKRRNTGGIDETGECAHPHPQCGCSFCGRLRDFRDPARIQRHGSAFRRRESYGADRAEPWNSADRAH